MSQEDGVTNVEDALEGATSDKSESPNAQPEKQGGGQADPGKGRANDGDFVPRSRLNEVLERAKTAESKLSEIEPDYKKQTNLIDAIKSLAYDEKVGPHVRIVDRAVQNQPWDDIMEDVLGTLDKRQPSSSEELEHEKQPSQPDPNVEKFEKLGRTIEERQAYLDDRLAQQEAEKLWSDVNSRASQRLKALPEEYTERDKDRLARMWSSRIDWESLDQDPSRIDSTLDSTLKDLLEDYGEPIGQIKSELTKELQPEPKLSPEDEVNKLLDDEDLGKVDDKGNPVLSDADIQQRIKTILRNTERGA